MSESQKDPEVICTIKHHTGREMIVTPGTYTYSGFGMGYLYVSDERKEWCTANEARIICEEEGLEFRKIDPLSGYTGTYLGD